MKRKFLGSVVALALAAPVYAGEMLSDAQIIGIYSQVNSFDIETALLGELKGHSDDVRAIGSMVSGDHSGVRQAIHQLASEMGVQPVLPPARIEAAQDHDTVIMQLRGLEGARAGGRNGVPNGLGSDLGGVRGTTMLRHRAGGLEDQSPKRIRGARAGPIHIALYICGGPHFVPGL